MPSEREIYLAHADKYESLVACEDYQGNILTHIQSIVPLDGTRIIEMGMGTGRLTGFLAGQADNVAACDQSAHMISQAIPLLDVYSNLIYCAADMRATPFGSNTADLVIAGWSFCYLAVWNPDDWVSELNHGLTEVQRLLKPGGMLVLLENYGTGADSPNPPTHLLEYFNFLREIAGFHFDWFRTDYHFNSLQEAIDLSGFFFGTEMAAKVRKHNWVFLPECTAIFWRRF